MNTPTGFLLHYRNPGHWDVYADSKRLYCIRGEQGRVTLYNELDKSKDLNLAFRTLGACMAYVCAELMTEDPTTPSP